MHRLCTLTLKAASACMGVMIYPAAIIFSDGQKQESHRQPQVQSCRPTRSQFAAHFDHTLLKPDATVDDIRKLCKEAHDNGFATVCVNSGYVALAKVTLESMQSKTKICSVVGFPLGASSTSAKVAEARQAIADGANEIDMVMNIGFLKSDRADMVGSDISEVVYECWTHGVPCKVILETCLLTDEEKIRATAIAIAAGADYVKTSTGFSSGGATIEDVESLASLCHSAGTKFKASGGIRDGLTAMAMLAAGADRIGASKSVEICEQAARIMEHGESEVLNAKSKSDKGY